MKKVTLTRAEYLHVIRLAWLNGLSAGAATTAARAEGVSDETAASYGTALSFAIVDDPIAMMQTEQMLSDWLDGKSPEGLSTMTVFTREDES